MKLRIQGNLVRLRLTQQEVARLRDHKLVECAIRFQSGRAFSYLLASSPDAPEVSVDYEGRFHPYRGTACSGERVGGEQRSRD